MSLVAAAVSLFLYPQDRTVTVDPDTGGYTVKDDSLPDGPRSITVTPKVNVPGTKATPYIGHDYTVGGS
jgi:hypothetical protein